MTEATDRAGSVAGTGPEAMRSMLSNYRPPEAAATQRCLSGQVQQLWAIAE